MIDKDARDALADHVVRAATVNSTSAAPEALRRERARAWNGSILVARIDDGASIPTQARWTAVGAAMQNFLPAASATGYDAKIASPPGVGSPRS